MPAGLLHPAVGHGVRLVSRFPSRRLVYVPQRRRTLQSFSLSDSTSPRQWLAPFTVERFPLAVGLASSAWFCVATSPTRACLSPTSRISSVRAVRCIAWVLPPLHARCFLGLMFQLLSTEKANLQCFVQLVFTSKIDF
jgi:hypothetical protein